jgi:hypothetical protein
MKHLTIACMLSAVCWIGLVPTPASAQTKCIEGKTRSGVCVNPLLAAVMRRTAIIFAQPKISRTAFPVLPSADRAYRYPNQLIPNPLKSTPVTGAPIL